jgi:triacylglycerol lipase
MNAVAQFQRFVVLGSSTFWWVLAAWLWPHAPKLALWCFAAPALITPGLIAIQFIAMTIINRTHSEPRTSAYATLRAWWVECSIAFRVFSWAQPFRSRSIADHLPASTQRGVVFVHGFYCNRGLWNHWLRLLKTQNRAFVAVNLEPVFGSIDDYVDIIDSAVQQVTQATGQVPLLVCHSMGGVAARAWLRRRSDVQRVHRIVTIGSPHQGTWLGQLSHATNGQQMKLGSAWIKALGSVPAMDEQATFICFYSDCDNIVFPCRTATLPGADNRFVAGVGHVELVFNQQVMNETLSLLS